MRRTVVRLVATLPLVALAAGGATIVAQSRTSDPDKTTSLTGVWSLNKDLSDDPEKVLEGMRGGDHGRSGGGQGGVGGHGPWMHRGGGGARRGVDAEQMRARMWLLEPPDKLTITQTDSSITVTESTGRSQTLTTNNKKQRLAMGDRMVEAKTKWDNGRLVKETSLDDGMKLTETYSLLPDPRRLQIMVKIEGSHMPRPVNFRRVYDAKNRW